MARRNRRDSEGFSLSFLDAISCGFGAVLLLLVLTKIYEPMTIERTQQDLEGLIARLQQELFEIRGETVILNRELESAREQVSESKVRLARLQGDLSRIQGRYDATKGDQSIPTEDEGELRAARQQLTEEMERLLADYRRPEDAPIGGIPVDSEYIVFVIDTSGSMQEFNWNLVRRKVSEVLDVYPQVKGMQIMNDNGLHMFQSFAGKWIPDTPSRRSAVLRALASWSPFSDSSPADGIQAAIATYADPDKKISIYVFGDDYSGQSVEAVADSVERMVPVGEDGERLVRIHAIGFPMRFDRSGNIQGSVVRFAALMRELAHRNGGTFVALTEDNY